MAATSNSVASGAVYLNIQGAGSYSAMVGVDLDLLTPRDRSDLMKSCLTQAVNAYVQEYMPKRFDYGYARFVLGYTNLASTQAKKDRAERRGKIGASNPNQWSGETRKMIMDSRLDVRSVGGATKGEIAGSIKYQMPAYINAQQGQITNKTVRKITSTEGKWIAEKFFAAMASAAGRIQTQYVGRDANFRVRGSLSAYDRTVMYYTSRASQVMPRSSSEAM